jgi:hypothetical protein
VLHWRLLISTAAAAAAAGVSGRFVHYLTFLQDLEQLVMAAAQDGQVGG